MVLTNTADELNPLHAMQVSNADAFLKEGREDTRILVDDDSGVLARMEQGKTKCSRTSTDLVISSSLTVTTQ